MLPTAIFLALSIGFPPPDADLNKRAESLVAHLGDPAYRDREKAARALLDIGYPARDAVIAGQKSSDSEVSERCTKLYPIIWRTDLEKRVQKFLDDPDGLIPADLPGAARWVKIAGNTKKSRELYATMIKAHPEPLLDVELHPERLVQVYTEFVRGVHSRVYGLSGVSPTGERPAATDSEVLLYLFLGAVGEVRLRAPPGISSSYMTLFFTAPSIVYLFTADATTEPFRKLYAASLEKERYSIALRRANDLAVQHKVRECAPALLRIAADPGTIVTTRASALTGFARIGTKDDIKDLAPFLKDELQLRPAIGNFGTVQMRDVALGAAVQIAGLDSSDFGFERKAPVGLNAVSSYMYYTFATDEKRAAAHAKWQEWAEKNVKK